MQNKHWISIQTILILLILFWPFKIELPLPAILKNTGIFFLVGGVILLAVAIKTLKGNFSPSQNPKAGGKLITTGLYSIVRHPAYGAILISLFGLSLCIGDGARLVLSACLILFFEAKSRMEEEWLKKKYSEYTDYKRHVTKKFIPGVF